MPTQSSQYPNQTAPKKLLEQVQQNGWYRQLAARVRQVNHLQTLFLQGADLELAQHCQVLEFNNGYLNLGVRDANWATHVRYNTPDLVKVLRSHPEFSSLKGINCYVYPDRTPIQPATSPQPNPIHAESAACIAEVAKAIVDPRLKNALLKLAGKSSRL